MSDIEWDIRRSGRRWSGEELQERYQYTPEKLEVLGGRLLASDEDRLRLLALLLENVGIDAAVRLGDPAQWRAAIAELG